MFDALSHIRLVEEGNPYHLQLELEILNNCPPTVSVLMQRQNIQEQLNKIEEKEAAQRKYNQELNRLKQQHLEEEALDRQRKRDLEKKKYTENKHREGFITDAFRKYVDSFLEYQYDEKLAVTIAIKFLKDINTKINDLYKEKLIKSVNCFYQVKTNDTAFNNVFNEMIKENKQEYISRLKFDTALKDYFNETLEKLETLNNNMATASKETRNQKKNDWANTDVTCEFCNRCYKKSNKKRHLDTDVCKKSRI